MTTTIRVEVEVGPKGKRVAAFARDWPGLQRGAKTEDEALASLRAYLPRYAPVARLAGLEQEFAVATALEVVERFPGVGSTDYWGISFAYSAIDHLPFSSDVLERDLALVRACWAYFDDARSRVSAELRKGPRGGGRDRDQMFRHTLAAERDWAKKLGVPAAPELPSTPDEISAFRDAYCAAIRVAHAEGRSARTWPLRFLIRHTAYHALDHAWEMEDKDLTG